MAPRLTSGNEQAPFRVSWSLDADRDNRYIADQIGVRGTCAMHGDRMRMPTIVSNKKLSATNLFELIDAPTT